MMSDMPYCKEHGAKIENCDPDCDEINEPKYHYPLTVADLKLQVDELLTENIVGEIDKDNAS